ncbi:MAG: nucleotidyltransferase domain-containing protein [Chloroflexota bacterium]|nr:nucleotidyltransferase domain-containing protein [Chloroflexota bacterium]
MGYNIIDEDNKLDLGKNTMIPEETLQRMVGRIVNQFDPLRLVLFGSQARGDAHAGSDFDLLIIAPSNQPRWKRTPAIYRLLAGSGIPKDIVWWTPEEIAEWRGVRGHFINTALREGKILYEKSP